MKKEQKIEVVWRDIGNLIPYARNARTHSDAQIAQIAASIKEFGFTNPVLIDGENGIIAGHGRVLAARKLSMERVPTIEISHLSETQRKAYILTDNKLALNAGWDADLLSIELAELRDLDFDLGLIGFDDAELAGLFDSDLPDPGDAEQTTIVDNWAVIVEFDCEEDQANFLDKMLAGSYRCRALI